MSVAKDDSSTSATALSDSLATAISHNNLLPEPEQHSIHALIASYDDRLLILDSEIAQVRSELNELVSKRRNAVEQLCSCRVAIAPHRRLPKDVIAEIFLWLVPETTPILISKDRAKHSEPYNILLVCSRWRNVALGILRLWNNLEVKFGDISKHFNTLNFARNTGTILSRSGQSTISMSIHCHSTSRLPTSISQMLRNLLVRSESRLRALTLDVRNPSLSQIFYDIPPGFFARLEAVTIHATNFIPTLDVLEAASELREFTLMSTRSTSFDPNTLLLPWAQLTTLHLSESLKIQLSDAHATLRSCGSLVNCKIHITASDYSPDDELSAPTTLPNLRTLHLTTHFKSTPWLQDFVFPGLITLELVCPSLQSSPSVKHFRPFFSHILELQNLELRVSDQLLEPIVQDMLRDTVTLTSLTLHGPTQLGRDILVMIGRGSLVPRLEHLACGVGRLNQALDMLESRLQDTRTTTIRDVTIFRNSTCEKKDMERVAVLRNDGVNLTVQCRVRARRAVPARTVGRTMADPDSDLDVVVTMDSD
jgi:hypothetical protein